MAAVYKNISGELTNLLVEQGANIRINKISFTNIHASTTCTLDLFIEQKLDANGASGKFYLLKSVSLPVGATLLYDDVPNISTAANKYSLFIKLTKGASETPTVDVIIS